MLRTAHAAVVGLLVLAAGAAAVAGINTPAEPATEILRPYDPLP
jgi:hypothetical protein